MMDIVNHVTNNKDLIMNEKESYNNVNLNDNIGNAEIKQNSNINKNSCIL
mgnify:CR=1 FL=1